ncbi:MAG: glycosyltransferase family 2 protein [Chloroflexi bacterium]|nr:glycosyltransferase family 2 protein [Chloroflexota bacterium]MYC56648.1 glycosyltransferase family 2 protein [Chloroflexota bacterium]
MRDAGTALDLAVIIVTWNNADVILPALQSLCADLEQSSLRHAIWLVDSASSDATVALTREQFPQVKLLASERNLGFGAANNLALRDMGFGDGANDNLPAAVYLLNPDTVVQPGSTQRLYDTLMGSAKLGLVGARLSYADGSFQHSAFRFPGLRQVFCELFPVPQRLLDGRFNGRYPRRLYHNAATFFIDFPLGAAMMLKREVIAQTGGFDEDFFIYCEEVDWAWRIHELGWRVLCEPRAHVIHLGGQSTGQARPSSFVHLWRSRLLLIEKQYANWKARLARWLIRQGMRRKLRGLDAGDAEMAAACREIIEMAQR